MRPRFSTHISRTCGGTENPRFLRKFQICGLITLLLDIGSLARGAKIHSHPQILTKKWPKIAKIGGFWGFSLGGSKRAIFGGVGYPPGGVKKGGFAYQIFIVFWPKRQIWSKRAIFWNFGHFGGFWGFWGFLGVQKVARNGNFGDFWGFPWGGRKRGQILRISRGFPRLKNGFF